MRFAPRTPGEVAGAIKDKKDGVDERSGTMPIAPDPFRMPAAEIMIEASGTFSVAVESVIETSGTF